MDEAFSVWMSSHPFHVMIDILSRIDAHPPLFYTMLKLWLMGGHSEAYLRLPSVFCGAVATGAIYLLGTELLGNTAGIVTALFWACSFVALNEETQVRMYAPAVALSILATYFFWRAAAPGLQNAGARSWRKWGLYILFATLSLYTHYYTGFVIAAHWLFLILKRRYKEAAGLWIILFALFAPWLPFFLKQFTAGQSKAMLGAKWVDFFFYFSSMLGTRNFFPIALNAAIAVFSISVFVLGAALLLKRKPDEGLLLVLLFAVPCFLPFFISHYSSRHIFIFRYIIIFLPYFYLIFFSGLLGLPRSAALPCLLALFFVNVSLRVLTLTGPAFQSQNWRQAAYILESRLETGDSLFVEQNMSFYPLWYYLPDRLQIGWDPKAKLMIIGGTPVAPRVRWYMLLPTDPEQTLQDQLSDSRRAWVILCQPYLVDPGLKAAAFILRRGQLISTYRLRSIEDANEIYLYLLIPDRKASGAGRK